MVDLYKVIELEDDTKWLICARVYYDKEWYSYLVRLNESEDDFMDDFKIVRTVFVDDEECVQIVKNKDVLSKVVPLLVPEAKKYIDNPSKLKELLGE